MRARLISRVISRIYDDVLRPYGLKVSQMSILAVIAGLGEADPLEVSRMLELDASTVSRNVRLMTTKGWIKASTKMDRRAHQLELTPEGEDVFLRAFPRWQEAQAKAAEVLGEENAERLRSIFKETLAKAALV